MTPPVDLEKILSGLSSVEQQITALSGTKEALTGLGDQIKELKGEVDKKQGAINVLEGEIETLKSFSANARKRSANAAANVDSNGGVPGSQTVSKADAVTLVGTIIRAMAATRGDMTKVKGWINEKAPGLLQSENPLIKSFTESSNAESLSVPGFLVGALIPLLRDDCDIMELGARVLPMPTGVLRYPVQLTGTQAQWVDGENPARSNLKWGRKILRSRKLKANSAVSKDLIDVSSLDVNQEVVNDLFESFREAFFSAAMEGANTLAEPEGLFTNSKVKVLVIGGAINADHPVKMIQAVKTQKVKLNKSAGFVFDTAIEEELLNLKTTTGDYHYREEMLQRKTLLGYKYKTCNTLTRTVVTPDTTYNARMAFGNWDELRIGIEQNIVIERTDVADDAWDDDLWLYKAILKADIQVGQEKAFVIAKDILITGTP